METEPERMTLAEFIAAHGLGMVAEQRTARPDQLMGDSKRHFKCTLHAGAATRWDGGPESAWEREFVVWFSQGEAHRKPPTIADVLDCLASDASGYENARSFDDWCGDYGYDTDSRTAERIYNATAEQAKGLRHFLGDTEAYDTLLFQVDRE